jgi:hypothetical protein
LDQSAWTEPDDVPEYGAFRTVGLAELQNVTFCGDTSNTNVGVWPTNAVEAGPHIYCGEPGELMLSNASGV